MIPAYQLFLVAALFLLDTTMSIPLIYTIVLGVLEIRDISPRILCFVQSAF